MTPWLTVCKQWYCELGQAGRAWLAPAFRQRLPQQNLQLRSMLSLQSLWVSSATAASLLVVVVAVDSARAPTRLALACFAGTLPPAQEYSRTKAASRSQLPRIHLHNLLPSLTPRVYSHLFQGPGVYKQESSNSDNTGHFSNGTVAPRCRTKVVKDSHRNGGIKYTIAVWQRHIVGHQHFVAQSTANFNQLLRDIAAQQMRSQGGNNRGCRQCCPCTALCTNSLDRTGGGDAAGIRGGWRDWRVFQSHTQVFAIAAAHVSHQ